MNLYDVLAGQGTTHFERLFSQKFAGGGKTQTMTGVPPLSFKANGKPLISWSMKGNGQQTGTPTPDAPIMPEFCGTLSGSDWTIPITCAGQTVPVYLGQTQTLRRVKKFVFNGTENWRLARSGGLFVYSNIHDYYRVTGAEICLISHYTAQPNLSSNTQVIDKHAAFYSNPTNIYDDFYIFDSNYEDAPSFKSYFAAQYAAGTPVTIWYVLREPTTGIANEPLAKIGDYADELSSTDAGVSIPTAKGQNTLTVDTELQPSEMTITFK